MDTRGSQELGCRAVVSRLGPTLWLRRKDFRGVTILPVFAHSSQNMEDLVELMKMPVEFKRLV